MDYRCVKEFNQNVGDIRFVAIFERRRAFRDSYTLPFNTLIAILEDGGSEVSLVENQLTHEVRPYRRYDLLFTPVWLPVLYTSFESLRLIALHFNLFRYPGMDVYNGCRDWIYGHDPAFVRRIEAAFRTADPLRSLTALRACCLDFCTVRSRLVLEFCRRNEWYDVVLFGSGFCDRRGDLGNVGAVYARN